LTESLDLKATLKIEFKRIRIPDHDSDYDQLRAKKLALIEEFQKKVGQFMAESDVDEHIVELLKSELMDLEDNWSSYPGYIEKQLELLRTDAEQVFYDEETLKGKMLEEIGVHGRSFGRN
jgi:hypothetical protein